MSEGGHVTVMKGSRVKARWFATPRDWHRTSLAGMQMKLSVVERHAEGVVSHIRGDRPENPERIEIAIEQSDGSEVWVPSGAIYEACPPTSTDGSVLWGSSPLEQLIPQQLMEKKMSEPSSKSGVTNTTREIKENPMRALAESMFNPRGSDGFIEGMEAQGQKELVKATDVLPTEGSEDPIWAAVGVIFGEKVEGDPVFRKVTLPAGWKKEAHADHAMWSNLLDERGRIRGKIFYKAAFYDRRATLTAQPRFYVESEFDGEYPAPCRYVIRDANQKEPLFVTEWAPEPEGSADPEAKREGYAKREDLRKVAEAKLLRDRPDYRNTAAYWNE